MGTDMDEEQIRLLEKALASVTAGSTELTASLADIIKWQKSIGVQDAKMYESVKKQLEQAKEAYKITGNWNTAILKSAEGFTNSSKQLDKFGAAITESASASKRNVKVLEKAVKDEVELRAESSKTFARQLGETVGDVGAQMTKAFTKASREMLYGTDAMTVSAGLMTAQVQMLDKGVQAGASALTKFGDAAAQAGGLVGKLGMAASIAGSIIGVMSGALSELAQQGIQFLLTSAKSLITNFNSLSASGVTFANGLKDLTKVSQEAGLTFEQLAKTASASAEIFTTSGYTMSEGVKKLAAVMKASRTTIDESGRAMSDQMLALGIGFEEQAALSARVMQMDNMTSGNRKRSEEELAVFTRDYAKNLKQISDFTGKDAKKMDDEAQRVAMEGDILAQLGDDPEAIAKFKSELMRTPDDLKKGFLQKFSTGTTNDTTYRLMETRNAAFAKQQEYALGAIKDKNVKTKEFNVNSMAGQSEAGNEQAKQSQAGGSMADVNRATRLGVQGPAADLTKAGNQMILMKGKTKEQIQAAADNLDKQATTTPEKGETDVVAMQKSVQEQQMFMQKLAMDNMGKFSDAMKSTNESLKKAADALAELSVGMGGKILSMLTNPALILGILMSAPLISSMASIFTKKAGGGTLPGLPGGGGAQTAGKGMESVASGASKLGGGVGSGIKSVLMGLADGLKALGSTGAMKGAGTLVILGASLWTSAKGLQEFAAVQWESMAKGFITLGGLALISKVLAGSTTDMIKGAVGIAALGVAAGAAAWGLKPFQEIDWETIGKGGAAIAGLAAVGAIAGNFMGLMIAGAAGIAALGAASWVAAWGLKPFQELEWETIGKGMVALGGIGVLGAIAGTAAPLLLLGAAGLGAIGLAAMAIGTGIKLISEGVAAMSDGGPLLTVGKALSQFYEDTPFVKLAIVSGRMSEIGTGLLPLALGVSSLKGVDTSVLGRLGAGLAKMLEDLPLIKMTLASGPLALFGKALGLFAKEAGDGFEKFNKELDVLSKIDAGKLSSVAKAIAELQKNFPKVDEGWWTKAFGGGGKPGASSGPTPAGGAGSGQAPAPTSSKPPEKIEQTTPPGKPAPAQEKPATGKPTIPDSIKPGTSATPSGDKSKKETQALLLKELAAQGITDPKAQANIMAQVQAESAFKPQSENMNYSGKRLYEMFGKGKNAKVSSLEDAEALAKAGPEAIGNRVYGGRMGNAKDEGHKYRGRGMIQLTGKDNYEKYGKMVGADLVANPELANDPAIAAKISAAYFADKQKRGTNLSDINAVGKAVGYRGGDAETAKRAGMAKDFESKLGDISSTKITDAKTVSESSRADAINKQTKELSQVKTDLIKTAPDRSQAEKDAMQMGRGRKGPDAGPTTVEAANKAEMDSLQNRYGKTVTLAESPNQNMQNISRMNSSINSMEDHRVPQYKNHNEFFNTVAANRGIMPTQIAGEMGPDGKRGKDPLSSGFSSLQQIMSKVADFQEQAVSHQSMLVGLADEHKGIAQKSLRAMD